MADERLHNWQRDIGLEQCYPDFTQGFLDTVFGQATLATQFLHGLGQALCQVIKHYLLRYSAVGYYSG
jgi:hypothetical protein